MTSSQKESNLVEMQQKFEKIKNQVCCCGNGVELRPSPFGGLGVFATKKFSKGDAVTLYGGQLIGIDEAKKRLDDKKDSHIRRHIARIYCYDGCFMPDGTAIQEPIKQLAGFPIGAFCNDSSNKEQINANFNFVDSSENERRYIAFVNGALYQPLPEERLTFVEAIRDIEIDEEILCSYGNQYWERSKEKKIASKQEKKTNASEKKKKMPDSLQEEEPQKKKISLTTKENDNLFASSYQDLTAIDTICTAFADEIVYFCRGSLRAWSKVVVLGGKSCLLQYVSVDSLPVSATIKEIPDLSLAEFKLLCESSFGTTLHQGGTAKDCADNFSKRIDSFLQEKTK